METFLFTSEFAIEGHPDKLCDQVSDVILDACLEQDFESKVACETCIEPNMVKVSGEVTTKAQVDYKKIVIDTCRNTGFVSADIEKCVFDVSITQQSPDIAQDVHGHPTKKPEEIGAGDQCHVFGYATDETPQMMPLSHVLATRLGLMLTMMRKKKLSAWLRPGGKTQVTIKYKRDGGVVVPIMVHTIRISVPYDESTREEQIFIDVQENVIRKVIPDKYLNGTEVFLDLLEPAVIGDAGRLTGRKSIIDTYGGWGAHGGGSFSGKDPTRVERSGAYIARQAVKSVVASELAQRCFVQVSYANGLRGPLSIVVDTYKTGKISDKEILDLIMKNFDFRPGMMPDHLDLKKVRHMRFQKTSAVGHFGMEDPDSPWEKAKHLDPRFSMGAGTPCVGNPF